MISEESVRAVDASYFDTDFLRPLYDSYCFSRIPHLIQALFDGPGGHDGARLLGVEGPFDAVVLLLVDGFGWELVHRYRDRYPFLSRFFRDGTVTKLTSQFPSTTAAHLTTLHTGLTPAESGIYEWFVYEPTLDTVIQTLPFAEIGNRTPGSLRELGLNPWTVFPDASIYPALSQRGISALIFQNRAFTPSPFGDVVMKGAHLHPFGDLDAGLRELAGEIAGSPEKRFLYLYVGEIDHAGHHYGPASQEFEKQVDTTFSLLERSLPAAMERGPGRSLLLMTADHGHIAVDPTRMLHLNRLVPEVEGWLRVSPGGRPMLPAGNARDMVLFIRPEHQERAQETLSRHLGALAEVRLVRDMVAENFFGSTTPAPTFLERMGDLIVLPHGHETVWWDAPRYALSPFRGNHGGLTRPEMETQLMSWVP